MMLFSESRRRFESRALKAWRGVSTHRAGCVVAIGLFGLAGSFAAVNSEIAGQGETPEAHLDRGDGHLAAREYDKAIAEYTRAIELKPDFAEAYNNRAYASYSKYDGTGDPLADLNRAIALRPRFPHAYNTRGCVYMAGGYTDKAIADFNQAIQLQPDYPRAYRNRANAYLRKGRIGLAIADFERVGENPKRIILYLLGALALVVALMAAGIYRLFLRRREAGATGRAAAKNGNVPGRVVPCFGLFSKDSGAAQIGPKGENPKP